MIQEDAQRCLELDEKIKRLESKIAEIAQDSKSDKIVRSNPGYGATCSSEAGWAVKIAYVLIAKKGT